VPRQEKVVLDVWDVCARSTGSACGNDRCYRVKVQEWVLLWTLGMDSQLVAAKLGTEGALPVARGRCCFL